MCKDKGLTFRPLALALSHTHRIWASHNPGEGSTAGPPWPSHKEDARKTWMMKGNTSVCPRVHHHFSPTVLFRFYCGLMTSSKDRLSLNLHLAAPTPLSLFLCPSQPHIRDPAMAPSLRLRLIPMPELTVKMAGSDSALYVSSSFWPSLPTVDSAELSALEPHAALRTVKDLGFYSTWDLTSKSTAILRFWQKMWNSWVRDKGQLITHSNISSQNAITGAGSLNLFPRGYDVGARELLYTQQVLLLDRNPKPKKLRSFKGAVSQPV